ncbi:hypothetical protein F7725_027808 [Dissostichus mawsoni]|uniref:Uncharacterized protein n=1 Tax=Dissostichus mawsoni TaxID=36200 RepID=A0A7J5XE78_DISMA|nr:hypothetical protein F7725_027808 [Dissostichus mawsoni]
MQKLEGLRPTKKRPEGQAGTPLPKQDNFVSCKKDEFACRSRLCISSHLRCNGVEDCGDGSDEASCLNCSIPGSFSCGPSDTCLPRNKLCDGRTDCKDGRDESPHICVLPRPRPQTSPVCAPFEFQCGDGHCIHQNECLVDNGGCSHRCVDQPMGFLCDCPSNMKLVGDSQCEEVDPCLESDVCDQLCVHMNGSLTCDCQEDYQRNHTTSECKAKGEEAQLVFPSSQGIRTISVTGTEHRRPALYLPGSGPVATLVSNRTLYWARPGRGSVYRVSLDGNKKDSVLKVEGSVSGLAVDWIHQLLYWTSMESGSVNVGLLDGSAQRPLITDWTDLQQWLWILSKDMPRQLLYWVDQGMRSISRVNLEGRHRKTVVESNGYLDQPFGLAVFEGFLYWSEEVTHSICRANKHNGGNLQVLLSNVTSPGGVVIVQPALQPNGMAVFLSVLLGGMALWWWREEFRPSRSLMEQSFSLKESQDPLIIQGPHMVLATLFGIQTIVQVHEVPT